MATYGLCVTTERARVYPKDPALSSKLRRYLITQYRDLGANFGRYTSEPGDVSIGELSEFRDGSDGNFDPEISSCADRDDLPIRVAIAPDTSRRDAGSSSPTRNPTRMSRRKVSNYRIARRERSDVA